MILTFIYFWYLFSSTTSAETTAPVTAPTVQTVQSYPSSNTANLAIGLIFGGIIYSFILFIFINISHSN
jgi:hypothetical protein